MVVLVEEGKVDVDNVDEEIDVDEEDNVEEEVAFAVDVLLAFAPVVFAWNEIAPLAPPPPATAMPTLTMQSAAIIRVSIAAASMDSLAMRQLPPYIPTRLPSPNPNPRRRTTADLLPLPFRDETPMTLAPLPNSILPLYPLPDPAGRVSFLFRSVTNIDTTKIINTAGPTLYLPKRCFTEAG